VVIPTYNRSESTLRAVRSAKSQRPFPPAEIIVVDDASSDDTAEVAEATGVRVIRHDDNLGSAAARNTGVVAAGHAWIALLDSDDEWLPDHLAELWRVRGDHVLVATSHVYVGPNGEPATFAGALGTRPRVIDDPGQIVYPANPIGASAAMFRREVAMNVDGFRTEAEPAEDFSLWLRILRHGSAVISPKVGVLYHLHGEQASNDSERMLSAGDAVLERHKDESWCTGALMEKWRGRRAWDQLRLALHAGDAQFARRYTRLLLAHPQRTGGALGLLVDRFRRRQRARRLSTHPRSG
jgi:glycosyltransferase involved in cell wall biosynthesis